MPNNDSHQHVVKTSAQWNDRAVEYWVVPRGCLCVELTSRGKTKLKVGEGNKYYAQLPYICDIEDLSDYYTKEEINNLFNNLNRMAIMSTEEYDEKSDLPLTGNKLGDVRFVKSSSPSLKIDPDVYLWNGHKWIFVGYDIIDIDLSQYIKREEFEPVAAKVDEMYPKMHTHENKETLDRIEEPYTTAEKDKLDSLENYDDTEIRALIRQATHIHPNKSILDQIQQPFKNADKAKLDSLENYDDTELRDRISDVEAVAHTHSNKDELDLIYSGFVNEHQVLVEFKTVAEEEIDNLNDDVADLKTKIHTHSNKNILDSTTAPYTTQDKATLDELASITIFDGAGPTYDGFRGYVPAPLAGQESYFLRGDGTWAKVKGGGDKYKAGEGIYILSGEATSDTFPFNIYSRAATLKQYIIYGNVGGVGNLVDGHYQIPIIVSAPGHPNRTSTIVIDDPMYDGDYIDFEKQVFAHYRTDITSQVQHPSTDTIQQGISSTGNIYYKSSYQGWGGSPRLTDYFEIDPTASYEISPVHSDRDFSDSLNINVYDENRNRTRTIITSTTDATLFVPMSGEKYIRQSYVNGTGKISLLQAVETPCVLQNVVLYPNAINTINVGTTIKPIEIYVEVDEPIDPDPDDPMSKYIGIIYNDGVLDITQEDPNNLNILTIHFRDDVTKDITINTGISEGVIDITQEDPDNLNELTISYADGTSTVINIPGGSGDEYVAGDGIDITSSEETIPVDMFTDKENLYENYAYTSRTSNEAVPYPLVVLSRNSSAWTEPIGDEFYIEAYDNNDKPLWVYLTFYNSSNTHYYESNPVKSGTHDNLSNYPTYASTLEHVGIGINRLPDSATVWDIDSRMNISPSEIKSITLVWYDSTATDAKTISAKLGAGLYFDANGAIAASGGGGTTYQAGEGINITSDVTPAIEAKLGEGLHFDSNDAIAADKYLAGQGIEIGYHEGIVVTNPEYYFDTQVTCALRGSFYREFTKTTDEPAIGALINCHNAGQSDSWTGPIFVGPTPSSVKCSYNTDNVIGPFTYKGRTWFSTGTYYWVDGSLTDLNHHLPRIPGQEQNVAPDDFNDFAVPKMIIDAAGFVESNNQDISAKLGVGLTFDDNDAIEIDDSIKLRLNCNNEPN